ncbi:MAG: hypothetical protein CMP48_00305 [Rickettsiales bacterium]|nr:hypothetical protein [Rickettsiales bacterium]
MPILNCYLTHGNISNESWDQLIRMWAERIRVDSSDICIHVFTDFRNFGAQYQLKVELFLPSIWSQEATETIQNTFLTLVEEVLKIQQDDTFLMTQLIHSGLVFDRGKQEVW